MRPGRRETQDPVEAGSTNVARMAHVSGVIRDPNILFVFTDQQRADSLGAVNGWARTPHLDALADEGVLFTSCFANAPVCIPSRFSLMSGLYPHNLGVQTNRTITYPTRLETWVEVLRRSGYRTSLFGKLHLHPTQGDLRKRERLVRRFGFDDVDEVAGPRALQACSTALTDQWERDGVRDAYRRDVAERYANTPWVVRPSPVGLDLYYDTYVGRSAAAYLRSYDRPEPWFCYVGFPGPHEPWDTPEPWASAYEPRTMPAPRAAPRSSGDRSVGALDRRLHDRPDISPGEIAALRADYAGGVSLIDDVIGEVLQVVRDRGEWDRTIVVFTSDHGEMNGDAGLLYKEVFLDGAVRVPLIIRDPTGCAGGEVADPVELIDVGATILDLAGRSDDATFRMGRSMAGVVRDPASPPPRTDVLSELRGEVMLATADWKIALNAEGETYLLFRRSGDESENLAGIEQFEDIQRSMEHRVLRRLVATSTGDQVIAELQRPSTTVATLLRRLAGDRRYDDLRVRLAAPLARARHLVGR
jgi:choline-sulfatase